MKVLTIDGQKYRLPGMLNPFQQEMYVHLINWKWEHITREPGKYGEVLYDAALPEKYVSQLPMLFPGVVKALKEHLQKYPFRIHRYFNHMASSQAANINLFLPILLHPTANAVFAELKSDLASLAISELDKGYRIEFWDEPFGNLHDKSKAAGTDSDIAIAYYNHQGELCLWLIEHKLTETEFTKCGGARSPRKKPRHDCSKSFEEILANKRYCFYHDMSKYNYWNITDSNQAFFANHSHHDHCPFKDGMNQLWRNQLLGLSIEEDERQPFKHATFSVVKHPRNTSLDKTLDAYRDFIANNQKFSAFTSADVLDAAITIKDARLDEWITWYKTLYDL